jgi:hypothetical protein
MPGRDPALNDAQTIPALTWEMDRLCIVTDMQAWIIVGVQFHHSAAPRAIISTPNPPTFRQARIIRWFADNFHWSILVVKFFATFFTQTFVALRVTLRTPMHIASRAIDILQRAAHGQVEIAHR